MRAERSAELSHDGADGSLREIVRGVLESLSGLDRSQIAVGVNRYAGLRAPTLAYTANHRIFAVISTPPPCMPCLP